MQTDVRNEISVFVTTADVAGKLTHQNGQSPGVRAGNAPSSGPLLSLRPFGLALRPGHLLQTEKDTNLDFGNLAILRRLLLDDRAGPPMGPMENVFTDYLQSSTGTDLSDSSRQASNLCSKKF